MTDQFDNWRTLASRLGVKVITPATVRVGEDTVTFAVLLPQFGGERGMVADPDWERIAPHADALIELGYGFSAVELDVEGDDESARDMLRDWGWSAPEPKPRWY